MTRVFLCILCIAILLTGCGIVIRSADPNDDVAADNNSYDNGGEVSRNDSDSMVNSGEVSGSDPDGVISGDEFGSDSGGMVISLAGINIDIEKQINYMDLVNLTADELGILRNAIFAKHGYIFKTAKYSDYFSSFDWYEPVLEDVNSRLTKQDQLGITLIKKAERFSEKSIKLSDEEKGMVGLWHLGAGAGAGYSDIYRFYEDGTYKYTLSQMTMDEREIAHAGKWFILDGILYLRAEREGILAGGELVDAEHPGSGTDKEIIGAEYKVRPLETFRAIELELDFDSDMIERDYGLAGVTIDNLDFYKLSTNPEDFSSDILDI